MNAIKFYRIGNWAYRNNIPLVPALMKNIIFLIYNSYIPSSCSIGEGTIFAYGGIGVVLHSNAKIGRGCVVGQGVTLGAIEGFVSSTVNKCPSIGDNCYIGAGAKILGDISIGDSCQVGAGAVVVKSAASNSVIVGIPGRVLRQVEANYKAIR